MSSKDLAAALAAMQETQRQQAELLAAIVAQQAGNAVSEEGNSAKKSRGATSKPRKRGSRSSGTKREGSAKASSARRKKGEKAKVWTVRESWAGETPNSRMLARAIQDKVDTPAKLAKLDKLALSCALGKHYGLPIVREA